MKQDDVAAVEQLKLGADTVLRFATGTPGGDTVNNDYFLDWAAMVNMKSSP